MLTGLCQLPTEQKNGPYKTFWALQALYNYKVRTYRQGFARIIIATHTFTTTIMKLSSYLTTLALTLAAGGALAGLSSCGTMMTTSVGVSTVDNYPPAIGGWWDDGSFFPPYWAGGVAGAPAWGVGAPARPVPSRPVLPPAGTVKPYPTGPDPVVGGTGLPGDNTKPIVPPPGTVKPYPTGPGPVVGGTGLPTLGPGNSTGGNNAAAATQPGRRPERR